jgi:hypothetical protein
MRGLNGREDRGRAEGGTVEDRGEDGTVGGGEGVVSRSTRRSDLGPYIPSRQNR